MGEKDEIEKIRVNQWRPPQDEDDQFEEKLKEKESRSHHQVPGLKRSAQKVKEGKRREVQNSTEVMEIRRHQDLEFYDKLRDALKKMQKDKIKEFRKGEILLRQKRQEFKSRVQTLKTQENVIFS